MRGQAYVLFLVLLLAGCASVPTPHLPPISLPAETGASTTPSETTQASDPLHWNGDVWLNRSLRLLPWQTLRIDPGTTIHVAKGTYIEGTDWVPEADAFIKDHDDPTGRYGYREGHIQIYGRIEAIGTRDKPIRFTSAAARPEYADWNNVLLLSGSRLENVSAAYMHNGIQLQQDGIVLRNVTVHDSLWSCIDVFSGKNLLRDIEAYHCWHQAIGFKDASDNQLIDAYLHDATLSVNCEHGALPTMQRLTIKAARMGAECPPVEGLTVHEGAPDVAGGTYDGRLVYPAPT